MLFEKLTGSLLIKKLPAFYRTRSFFTVFTSAYHLSLFWASSIPSITPSPTPWRSIIILSSNPYLLLPNGAFPSVFPQTAYIHLTSHHTRYMTQLFHSSRILIEVIIQHWPHTIRCQYHCTQHSSLLSQSEAHSTDATVDEQTKCKPHSAIPVLSSSSVMFQLSGVSVMSPVCVTFFSSTAVLTANGNF